jgi:hypothetical protein
MLDETFNGIINKLTESKPRPVIQVPQYCEYTDTWPDVYGLD